MLNKGIETMGRRLVAKSKQIAIAKKATKPANTLVDIRKKENDMISGGIHSHWRHWENKDFTNLGGSHDHVFIINGKLYKTEYDGEHLHKLNKDGSVSAQLANHAHGLFIDGEYYPVDAGGAHDHKEGLDPQEIERVLPGGEHRHTVEVGGVTYESITSSDLFAAKINKSLCIGVQSLVLSKGRFLTFEAAAQKADALGVELGKTEERTEAFIFTQKDMGLFKEFSLQTISLEDGVDLVIGVLIHEEDSVDNNISLAPNSPRPMPAQPPVAPEVEVAAFDEVQNLQTLGYAPLSEDEIVLMQNLNDDIAEDVMALKAVVEVMAAPITEFLDAQIEKAAVNENQDRSALLDRVNTTVTLLKEALEPVQIGDITVEMTQEFTDKFKTVADGAGAEEVLSIIKGTLAPLVDVFKDTSFHRFHVLTKSANLSISRVLKERMNVEKVMIPMADMTREDLRIAQEARSARWGIEIVSGSALTFPSGFPTDLNEYGDPVNLKFPFNTKELAANARVRFKQFANQLYTTADSKRVVHTRIVERELAHGIAVVLDQSDALDQLLPSGLFEDSRVTVVAQASEIQKRTFIPVLKDSDEERTVFGIVLEPDITDVQLDTYDEETVKKAAHHFMENMQNIGKMHTEIINDETSILESYVAPITMNLETPAGKVKIKKGTWLMKVRILDDFIWQQVKNGELTGFSIGALATVTDLTKKNKESK